MHTELPNHIAIVMDGNGRWATKRGLPRIAGHKAGLESVRKIVTCCAEKKISFLSLFAFSSENWLRPIAEVDFLLDLLLSGLKQHIAELHSHNVKLWFIGEIERFDQPLRTEIYKAQQLTANNTGMQLNIAVNYGGRWDIVHAVKKVVSAVVAGKISPDEINQQQLVQAMSLGDIPDPDLFIRTSGEQRLSNFLLWQLAYSELYFTDLYWPDFREEALELALAAYKKRQRRFGLTSDQIKTKHNKCSSIE